MARLVKEIIAGVRISCAPMAGIGAKDGQKPE
jgi:hypothetical protein